MLKRLPRAQKHTHTHTWNREKALFLRCEEQTVWGGVTDGEGLVSGGGGRDPHLMSIWWVFCRSRDLFVLLLIPESSIPPRWRAPGGGCRGGMGLVLLASCLGRLIGSSWIDPRSFPHLNCDLILHSGASGMYLNAIFLHEFMKERLVRPPRPL